MTKSDFTAWIVTGIRHCMAGFARRRRSALTNAVAVVAAFAFVLVQSAMLQVHAAPADALVKGAGHTHDATHDHGSMASTHADGHAQLPDSTANVQACDDLCCISGCLGALIAGGYGCAAPAPVHAFLSTVHLPYFGQATAPPYSPPRS